MSSSYKTIFWGLLLLAFNFYLGSINILPDFLGFIIISKGLRGLCEDSYEEYFRRAKIISNFMIIISIVQYIGDLSIKGSTINGSVLNLDTSGVIFFTIGNFVNLITLVLIYYILKGIYVEAENRGIKDFMLKINSVWNIKLVISLVMLLLGAFMINIADVAMTIIPFAAIFAVVIQIRVAFVVKEAGKIIS